MTEPEITYVKTLKYEDFTEQSQIIAKDYICPLCEGVYFDPVIDMCGHISCEKCFQSFDPSFTKCPFTNEPISSRPTKVSVMTIIIEKQILYCSNTDKGCTWEGQVKDYQFHITNECPKQLLKCSMIGCNQEVPREDFKTHLVNCNYRNVDCEFCKESFPFIQLESHYESCPKYLIECPQQCSILIQREALSHHVEKECNFTKVNCCYFSIGCSCIVQKNDLENHKKEYFNQHLDLILQSIYNQTKKTNERFKSIETRLSEVTNYFKNKEESILISSPLEMTFIGSKREREEDKGLLNVNSNALEINKKYHEDLEKETERNKLSPELIPDLHHTIFDLEHQPPGVSFLRNRAKNISNNNEHRFIFINAPFDLNHRVCHWKIKFISPPTWIGLGLCNKEKVIENDYRFHSKKNSFVHGTYLVSTNGYIWNSNNSAENSVSIHLPLVSSGDIIEFLYQPSKQDLMFQIHNFKYRLTKVEGNDLTCCILFLNHGNEVEVLFDS